MDLRNLVRIGVVSAVSPDRCAVRVLFSDQDDLVTDWLPVIVPQASKNRDYVLPAVDDTVICLFLGNGIETGFCLGSIYTNNPPTSNPSKRGTWFADGSYVEFDSSTGNITVNAKGKVIISAASIIQIAGDGLINGNVHITGNLVVDGSITRGGEPV